jgi:HK97 family phage major capsid protein
LTDAYFAGAPVQDPGTPNESVNRILRAKTLVYTVADATATFIVANPADTEVWNSMTDANQQYLLGGPQGAMVRTLWGLPIVESQNIAAGTAIVGDGTMAAIADRNQARIYTTDSHSDFFIRNIIVVLAEQRLAVPVFRPAAFVKVDLTA